jgi:hypothetical protein
VVVVSASVVVVVSASVEVVVLGRSGEDPVSRLGVLVAEDQAEHHRHSDDGCRDDEALLLVPRTLGGSAGTWS